MLFHLKLLHHRPQYVQVLLTLVHLVSQLLDHLQQHTLCTAGQTSDSLGADEKAQQGTDVMEPLPIPQRILKVQATYRLAQAIEASDLSRALQGDVTVWRHHCVLVGVPGISNGQNMNIVLINDNRISEQDSPVIGLCIRRVAALAAEPLNKHAKQLRLIDCTGSYP